MSAFHGSVVSNPDGLLALRMDKPFILSLHSSTAAYGRDAGSPVRPEDEELSLLHEKKERARERERKRTRGKRYLSGPIRLPSSTKQSDDGFTKIRTRFPGGRSDELFSG